MLKTVTEKKRIIEDPSLKVKIAGFTPGYVELEVSFWINTFKQEQMLAELKTEVMYACRTVLRENDYTLSSSGTTALSMAPMTIHMEKEKK